MFVILRLHARIIGSSFTIGLELLVVMLELVGW
jgi:hypothetical protein